jgi:hypothetical protein
MYRCTGLIVTITHIIQVPLLDLLSEYISRPPTTSAGNIDPGRLLLRRGLCIPIRYVHMARRTHMHDYHNLTSLATVLNVSRGNDSHGQ